MVAFNVALLIIGSVVVLLGLFSRTVERIYLSEPLVALIVGIILSQFPSADFLPTGSSTKLFLEEAARLTLGVSLIGIALRLPKTFFIVHWRPIVVLLGIVMPLMFFSSGLMLWLAGLPVLLAISIGAVVTATDPVLASSIVTGETAEKKVSPRVRHVISAEAGANDGLAYLFVMLPLLLSVMSAPAAVSEWLVNILLRGILGSVMIGFVLGYAGGFLMQWADKKGLVNRVSFLAYTIGLSLAVLGGTKLLGSDGILAVFIAGAAFSLTLPAKKRDVDERRENFQEALNRFFILPIFVFLGMELPWTAWGQLGWPVYAGVIGILLFRRIPWTVLLNRFMGDVKGLKNNLFIGWFGPIGAGALYYALLVERLTGDPTAWEIGSFLVFGSVLLHGLTATPFTRLYASMKRQ